MGIPARAPVWPWRIGLTIQRQTRYDMHPRCNWISLTARHVLYSQRCKGDAMKLARFQTGGQIKYGIAEGENIREIRGDLFGDHTPTGMVYAINTVKLLVPCTPSKLLALGLNYALHVAESSSGRKPPECPEIFYKVPSSLWRPDHDPTRRWRDPLRGRTRSRDWQNCQARAQGSGA